MIENIFSEHNNDYRIKFFNHKFIKFILKNVTINLLFGNKWYVNNLYNGHSRVTKIIID